MAQTIRLKRSAVAGRIPSITDLDLGEVAINTVDGKMYIKKSVEGVETIVEIGANSGLTAASAAYQSYIYTATAGQTVFTGLDNNSKNLYYNIEAVEVLLNGVLLDPQSDYTALNNSSITINVPAELNDTLQVVTFVGIVGSGDIVVDTFTSDGIAVEYTLSGSPDLPENLQVFIDGVYQEASSYSVIGNVVTLSEAPAAGSIIETRAGSRNITLGELEKLTLDALQLTGGTGNQGTLSWNVDEETLDLVVSPDVTYQIGQELGLTVRNLSGQTITNGTVVRVTGASGNKATVDLADYTAELGSSSTFAVVTEDIGNNSTGHVTTNGLVRGLDTSTYTEGAAIWLGSTGAFTTIKPLSPNHLVHIGWVVRSHPTEGAILVSISNGWEIEELHDVLITNLADTQMLQWDETATVWKNVDSSTTNIAEGTNLYYTVTRANTAIDTRVTKTFVDALNVNSDTLDGQEGTYYLDYTNFTNKPTIPANVFRYASDGVNQYEATGVSDTISFLSGTNTTANVNPTTGAVSFNVVSTGLDSDTLDGQEGSYYLDYNNFTNVPALSATLDDLQDVDLTTVAPIAGQVLKYDGINWVPAADNVGSGGGGGLNYSQSYITEDQYIGDGSTTTFALSQLPTSDAHVIVSLDGSVQDPTKYSTSGTSLIFNTAPTASQVVDIRTIKATTSVVDVSNGVTYTFTINAPTTSITGVDDNGQTLAYVNEKLSVYLNGLLLVPTVDYGAVNGTSISFNDTIPAGSVVLVVSESAAYFATGAPIAGDEVILLTAAQTTVATYDASLYRTAKMIVQVSHITGGYHAAELLIIHDGTTVYMTEYATIFTLSSLGTFDAVINNGNVEVSFTPTSLTDTVVRTKWIAVEL